MDRVWESRGDLVYLLPECNREQASGFVRRLSQASGIELPATIACFPEDGLTGGLLIDLVLGGDAELHSANQSARNGNGAATTSRRRRLGRLLFLHRRREARAAAAMEWTEIAPAVESEDSPEPSLVASAERATR